MKDNATNIPWQKSLMKYHELFAALHDLIVSTQNLSQCYEDTNMKFAQLIYEKDLYQLMNQANVLKEYERSFELMYYSLKGQVKQLQHLRDMMQLFLIKDPVNIPAN